MARSRLLKPDFFLHETLAECSFAARLLYQGLWCVSDREGKLEDRPMKLKIQIFPYDILDIEALLKELEQHNFIIRYKHGRGKHLRRYIAIPTFLKHQSPHPKEAKSTIPDPFSNFAELHGKQVARPSVAVAVAVAGSSDPVAVAGDGGATPPAAGAEALREEEEAAAAATAGPGSLMERLTEYLPVSVALEEIKGLRHECILDCLWQLDRRMAAKKPPENPGGLLRTMLRDEQGCMREHKARRLCKTATERAAERKAAMLQEREKSKKQQEEAISPEEFRRKRAELRG